MDKTLNEVMDWLKTKNHCIQLGWDEDEECCEVLLVNVDGKIIADSGQCYPPEVTEDEIEALLKEYEVGEMLEGI